MPVSTRAEQKNVKEIHEFSFNPNVKTMARDKSVSKLIEEHRQDKLPQVEKLVREGHSPAQISEKTGVAETTVRRWIERYRLHSPSKPPAPESHSANPANSKDVNDWTDSRDWRGDCLKAYWSIYRQAMIAWRDSKKDKCVKTVETTDDAAQSKKKKSHRQEDREGEAVYLGKAMEALKAIREMLGLDAPRRSEVAVSGAAPIELAAVTVDDIPKMTNRELHDFIARLRTEAAALRAAEQAPPQLSIATTCSPNT